MCALKTGSQLTKGLVRCFKYFLYLKINVMVVLCSVCRSPSSRGTFGRAKVMRRLVRGACLYLAERAGTHAPLPFMLLFNDRPRHRHRHVDGRRFGTTSHHQLLDYLNPQQYVKQSHALKRSTCSCLGTILLSEVS